MVRRECIYWVHGLSTDQEDLSDVASIQIFMRMFFESGGIFLPRDAKKGPAAEGAPTAYGV